MYLPLAHIWWKDAGEKLEWKTLQGLVFLNFLRTLYNIGNH